MGGLLSLIVPVMVSIKFYQGSSTMARGKGRLSGVEADRCSNHFWGKRGPPMDWSPTVRKSISIRSPAKFPFVTGSGDIGKGVQHQR